VKTWVLLLLVAGNVFAADAGLDIDPGHSVLGLPATATPADFSKALGEPAAEIAMFGGRRGLLFGRNMMLVFKGDGLWEARAWQIRNWTPQLFHEWLQYVPDTGQSFSVAGAFKVGMHRDALEQQLRERALDGDEFSLVSRFGPAQVWFGFEYDDDVTDATRSPATQHVVSMTVSFEAPGDPESVVDQFYAAWFESRPDGLPDATAMQRLSPFLSPHLRELFVHAEAAQSAFMEQQPDEKPPLIEGNLFSSLFEGPHEYKVAGMEEHDGNARVMVDFTYADPQHPDQKVQWQDAVLLVRDGDAWRIDDIEYLGNWEFKPGARLTEVLQDVE
jgi:hypothetical protein